MANTPAANNSGLHPGLLTLPLVMLGISLLGAPDDKALAALTGWGMPRSVAAIALHAAPVIATIAALVFGRIVARGRSSGLRWLIYAGFGALAGGVLGFSLDLFVGAPKLITSITGPLGEATLIDIALWAQTGLCIAIGFMIAIIAVFGRSGAMAMQVEETDPELLDIRRGERRMFAWSALAMVTLGLASGGLVVGRLAEEGARGGPVLLASVAGVVCLIANLVLWRDLDEMQRRQVIDAYAVSALVITLGAFVWAAAQIVGALPALDAAGVFVALVFVQIIATLHATSSAAGQISATGRAA